MDPAENPNADQPKKPAKKVKSFFVKRPQQPQRSDAMDKDTSSTVEIRTVRIKLLEVRSADKQDPLIESGDEGSTAAQMLGAAAGGDLVAIRNILLLENGPEMVQKTRTKHGALGTHLAAGNGHAEGLKMLLDGGGRAQMEAADDDGETALHWAARAGHIEVVRILLLEGVNVNARNGEGETPLHQALLNGRTEVAKLLIGHGADAGATTSAGGHSAERYLLAAQQADRISGGEAATVGLAAMLRESIKMDKKRTKREAKAGGSGGGGGGVVQLEMGREDQQHKKPASGVKRIQQSLLLLSSRGKATSAKGGEGASSSAIVTEGLSTVKDLSAEAQATSPLLTTSVQSEEVTNGAGTAPKRGATKTIRSMFVKKSPHSTSQEAMLLNKAADDRGHRGALWSYPWCLLCCVLLLLLLLLLLLIPAYHLVRYLKSDGGGSAPVVEQLVGGPLLNGSTETDEGPLPVTEPDVGLDLQRKEAEWQQNEAGHAEDGHPPPDHQQLDPKVSQAGIAGSSAGERSSQPEAPAVLDKNAHQLFASAPPIPLVPPESANLQQSELDEANRALVGAVSSGDLAAVRLLLAKWNGQLDLNRALLIAACEGKAMPELIEALLEAGADAEARQEDGTHRTPLQCAAERGNAEVVRRLVRRGADPGSSDDNAWTPLHFAAQHNHDQVSLALLENVQHQQHLLHVTDIDGLTPVERALQMGSLAVLRVFLANWGRALNNEEIQKYIQKVDQWQPPHREKIIALLRGVIPPPKHIRLAVGSVEVAKGSIGPMASPQTVPANPMRIGLDSTNERQAISPESEAKIALDDGTPPMEELSRAIAVDDVGRIRVLLARWRDRWPRSILDAALLTAACEGKTEMVQLLLEAGASVETRGGQSNHSPLHCAAKLGRAETVRLLLMRGANFAARDDNGWTPLHFAANSGHDQTALLLLEHGGWNVQEKDNEGQTPVGRAVQGGSLPTLRIFLANWGGRNRRATAQDIDPYLRMAQHWPIPNKQEIIAFLHEARPRTMPQMVVQPQHVEQSVEQPKKVHSLHNAVKEGNPEQVLLLLRSGVDVNSIDAAADDAESGYTPLHEAVIAPDEAMVKVLLDHGARVNALDGSGLTPLHRAAALNRIRIMHLLLLSGANVSAEQTIDSMNLGKTPMHLAAKNGHTAAIELLLRNGANPKARDDRGWMPLHHAVLNGHETVSWTLLYRCQDISDDDIRSVFDAIEQQKGEGSANAETTNKLMDMWIALLTRANRAYRYQKWMFFKAVQQGDVDLLADIVATHSDEISEIDLNGANDAFGNRALHFAAWFGRANLARQLLAKSADAMARNKGNETALQWAALSGKADIVDVLLQQANVDPNWKNAEGKTALHFAVDELGREQIADQLRQTLGGIDRSRSTKLYDEILPTAERDEQSQATILKKLLEGGANVAQRDNPSGWTALQYAIKYWRPEAVRALAEWRGTTPKMLEEAIAQTEEQAEHPSAGGATMRQRALDILRNAKARKGNANPENGNGGISRNNSLIGERLMNAARAGDTQLVRHLIDSGADVNKSRNAYGNSALHLAATYGHLETVQLLLRRGANVGTRNTKQKTPLYYASCEGKEQVAQALILGGADVNAVGTDGDSALHCAAEGGWTRIVELLLRNNVKVNAINSRGYAPLHWAAMYGKLDSVRALLSAGADFRARASFNGVTPLHLAAQEGHEQIARLLMERGAEVGERDRHGWTPLHYAVKYGKVNSAKALLERWQSPMQRSDRDALMAMISNDENAGAIRELLIRHRRKK